MLIGVKLRAQIQKNMRNSKYTNENSLIKPLLRHHLCQGWVQIRFIKYKYKYESSDIIKYKYKYKYADSNFIKYKYKYKYEDSNTNTNIFIKPNTRSL